MWNCTNAFQFHKSCFCAIFWICDIEISVSITKSSKLAHNQIWKQNSMVILSKYMSWGYATTLNSSSECPILAIICLGQQAYWPEFLTIAQVAKDTIFVTYLTLTLELGHEMRKEQNWKTI